MMRRTQIDSILVASILPLAVGLWTSPVWAQSESLQKFHALEQGSPAPAETPIIHTRSSASEASDVDLDSSELDEPTEVIQKKIRYNPRVPIYQRVKPQWAMEIAASMKALGTQPSVGGLPGTAKIKAVSLQMEYQPKEIQDYGVLSIGPNASIYPITPRSLANGLFGLWSLGAQVRYQARYFREQPIVPMAGYGAEYAFYDLNGSKGNLLATGPMLGAMLLLNVIDSSTAAEFYVNHEVARSYLVAEYRSLRGSSDVVNFSGSSVFFGLRFEF